MNYRSPEWTWYVAQLVIESRVEGVPEPILMIESVLLQAESPDVAYNKAMARCASSDHGYRNKTGAPVVQRYLGIHDIEDLQAERMEDEQVLLMQILPTAPQYDARLLLRSKSELSLFGGESPEFLPLAQ